MSLAAALALLAAPTLADLAAIDGQVAAFTGAAIGAQGGAIQPIDRRLRLTACAAPLALAWRTERRETVEVRCPDAGGWRLYVPVRAVPAAKPALPAVNRGDGVTIAVSGRGFTVSQPGEALEAGKPGAWIRVRTLDAKVADRDVLRARVVRPGLVSVALP